MRFIFSLVIGLFFSLSLNAQSEHYNFSRLDIYSGLSQNQVNSILRDQYGFLWIGTMSGLNRYDGYSCKVLRSRPGDSSSLIDNYINSLSELPGGKIWVMTRNLPCIYDSRTEKFIRNYSGYLNSLGLPGGSVSNIVKGSNGRYWFLYDSLGLYCYTEPERKSRQLKTRTMTAAKKITAAKESAGMLWMINEEGLLQKLDIKSNRIIYSSNALQKINKGAYTYKLFIDREDDIWIWTANTPGGVFLFNHRDNSMRQFNEQTFPSNLNTNLITEINQDSHGMIWVATDHGGVNLINKKQNFETSFLTNDPKDSKSLSQNSITSLIKDDYGIIWIGTYKQGINYLNENIIKFPHYHHQEYNKKSLPYDDVNRFVEDKAGNLWIGTNGGGLIYFNRATNSFSQYLHDPKNPNSISNNVIVSLCIDQEDMLWIGSYFGGLSRFDGKNFKHYKHADADPSSLADDRVWEIFEDRDSNLWM